MFPKKFQLEITNNTKKTNQTNSVKKCPSTKELNPMTNRCVNKCKPNYTRNSKFKCVKNKTNKSIGRTITKMFIFLKIFTQTINKR